jgi:hypothetical protein
MQIREEFVLSGKKNYDFAAAKTGNCFRGGKKKKTTETIICETQARENQEKFKLERA